MARDAGGGPAGATRPSGRRLPAALLVALLGALLSVGCADEGLDDAAGDEPTAEGVVADVAPPPPPAVLVPGSLVGTWWALAPDLAHKALRMTFEAPEDAVDEDMLAGSWISFDWRATDTERDLARKSRAVAVTARRQQDEWIVQGPAPQIDARGQPNGDKGHWELRVRRVSLPGEELVRHAGRLVHTDLTPAAGVTVELTPRFRPYGR